MVPLIKKQPGYHLGPMDGFTFIEVMVAMLIFTMAVLAASNIADGSVKATRDTRDVSRATWLLQSVMTQLETRLESEGIEKACDKKKDGKFEGANEGFTWKTECYEIEIKLSQTAAKMAQDNNKDSNGGNQEDLIQKMVLDLASDYISKSLREIHAEVYWNQGKAKRTVTATTHFVRYDQQAVIPNLGGIGGGDGKGEGKLSETTQASP
jgi:prepilin-type N-terminal cleavage/methylation domain-containing protein